MVPLVLSSPVPRAQQSAHTTLDTTNKYYPPCSLDMLFAGLLRFVDSALGVIGWMGALDSIACIELLPYLFIAICVAAYGVRICAAIVNPTCIAAIFMETQAPVEVEGLEAEGEAEVEAEAEEVEEEAEIEAVVPPLPTRTTMRRRPVLAPLALPEACEAADSNVPVLVCFRQSPSQRGARVQRGFGAVHCVQQSVITASSWQQVHQLLLTTRRLAAGCRLQCRWRGLVARRTVAVLRAQARAACRLQCCWRGRGARRSVAALRAAFCADYPEFACCSTEVSALLAAAIADPKRILGAGAFGTVYRPRGWAAAVKVVSLRDAPKAASALVNEAHLLQMASVDGGSSYVLRMQTAFRMGDHACIALDLAVGGDLLRYMRRTHRGYMPMAEAFLYTQQLAAAVAWLHAHNVAHRDIKLDNVLLREPGHVMLADLGLGVDLSTLKEWEGSRWCNEECGTQTTMAPEIFGYGDYDRYYDPTLADVWSLGITVVALLAPRTPDEHGYDRHGYYAWSSAAWSYSADDYDYYEDEAYGQYVTLQQDAAATPGGPTAIAMLLQTSDEHDRMPQQLPAAVLVALDRMLRTDPDARISAAEVVSLLLAEPTPGPCHLECYSEC